MKTLKQLTKQLTILALTMVAASAFAQAPAESKKDAASNTPKAHILKSDELDKLLAQPNKVLLIDVRRPDEVSSIGGFPAYFSVQIKELENSLKWIPKDRTIVTVSNHAGRAAKAADLLASKGFKVAGAVGSETYEKEGGKWVTRIAIPVKAATTAASSDRKSE